MTPQPHDGRQTRAQSRQTTHELYLHGVRDLVVARATTRGAITAEQAFRLAHTKLLYGVGDGSYRGVTLFNAWHHGTDTTATIPADSATAAAGAGRVDIVEVAATGQESWVQVAGTVIHELAHVLLAGHAAGHGTAWKDAAVTLGFSKRPAAAGQTYHLSMIEPAVRYAVHDLAQRIGDGRPEFRAMLMPTGAGTPTVPRPCSAGVGTRGGGVAWQGFGVAAAVVGVRLYSEAGQGPGRLRRLPGHLRPMPHRVHTHRPATSQDRRAARLGRLGLHGS